ncbi:MAG: hypothetical protein QOH79_2306 [Acidimicrobiaceae bacterium]
MKHLSRSVKLDGEALFCVATYGDDITYPVSYDDVEADIAAARRALSALGLKSGDTVLLVSTIEESAHFWPLQAAIVEMGMLGLLADATLFDAIRVEMLLRRFTVNLAIGVNNTIVEGLRAASFDVAEVLGRAQLLAARLDAVPALQALGLGVHRWVALGPTYAIDCRAGRLHFDSEAWDVSSPGGEIVVRPTGSRALGGDAVATGVMGHAVTEVCPCGRPDAALVLDDASPAELGS